MRSKLTVLTAFAFFLAAASAIAEPLSTAEKLDVVDERHQLDYLQYLPEDYAEDVDRQWPLVVFLHGAGERGSNLDAVKAHGPPKLAENGKKFPFILIAPQCPAENWWTWQPLMPLIEHLEATLSVDSDRIILTGLSMGGFGTWDCAARYPEKFAAIAPICGGGIPYLTNRTPNLPVWAFHGAKDTVIKVHESERLIEALKKNGNKHAWLTIYPEAGHNSWTEAYDTEALYQWMLDQKRGEPGQPPSPHIVIPAPVAADAQQ